MILASAELLAAALVSRDDRLQAYTSCF